MPTNDITYKSKITDASYELNKHFTGILDYGVYEGLFPASIEDLKVVFNAGVFLDRYGRRISFNEPETVSFDSGSTLGDRIDTVCIKVAITAGSSIGSAFLVTLKGTPSKYPVPAFNSNNDVYPIAYVKVRAGSNTLDAPDVKVADNILTHNKMYEYKIRPIFDRLYGTVKLSGFDVSYNTTSSKLDVTPGEAIIRGEIFYCSTTESLSIPEFPGVLGLVSGTALKVINPTSQPKIPVRVKIKIITSAQLPTSGYIRIEGLDHNGATTYELVNTPSSVTSNTECTYESAKYFTSIDRVYIRDFNDLVTYAECRSINKAYVYGEGHGINSYIPMFVTTIKETEVNRKIFLAGFTVDGTTVTVDEKPSEIMKVMMGSVCKDKILLNGAQGTRIVHGLGNTSYSYFINPEPASKQEAITIGVIYCEKKANELVIYNTGSAKCTAEITLIAGV